ncbi:uncharacterized protein F4807DRAFT_463463 [Annulohypoxylon truncatum]|uniref:uncharacterized protein n=1 Tax=Annulohypoxylon truncatum TaxID=327061 RepID=UPI002007F4C1|nr:uncharacterized protein F4807DRAFT_463463 [Annulohypoxylon truncatum]KAI1206520.1 hypothetical protein F4807DRAFT_463463 [Annulohypoxylon truncatum]
MFDSFRQLGRLSLPILSCWSTVQAVAFPATVEVHLVFPRNDTYAPSELTPIVFAIYNSELAGPLDLNFDYNIWQLSHLNGTSDGGFIQLTNVNFTNASDPYYAYTTTNVFNTTEGEWSIVWDLSSGNCSNSTSIDESTSSGLTYYNRVSYSQFTTKNGAKQPDLNSVTTADDQTCANIVDRYFTFNVTGTLPTNPDKLDGRATCAVIAPPFQTAPTATTSCPPTMAASAVSSISAAITAIECKGLNPVVSCPPENAAGKATGFLAGRTAWLKTAALNYTLQGTVDSDNLFWVLLSCPQIAAHYLDTAFKEQNHLGWFKSPTSPRPTIHEA